MGELSSYDLGHSANNEMTLAKNLSDVERGRGGGGVDIASPTNDTATNLIQMPVGRCLFF
jgi:hypothetical protein